MVGRLAVFFASAVLSVAAQQAAEQVRVLGVEPTPEPETVNIRIQLPETGSVVKGNPVWVQVRVDGYDIGNRSHFDRADEVADSELGQSLHVVIDNLPYFAVNGPAIDPFNEQDYFWNNTYQFEVPIRLSNGIHTIRVFPCRSYGESLKGDKAFEVSSFYVGSESGSLPQKLTAPFLTYNEPSDAMMLKEGKPVLLDFYITNCELTPDGYKVRLTIDNTVKRLLTAWRPYYIYGLKKGRHTFRLELLDPKNKVVPGPFNDVTRTFSIF
jgi:hypothetical protein